MSYIFAGGNSVCSDSIIGATAGGGVTPANGYITEDSVDFYVAEDGTTFYVQE